MTQCVVIVFLLKENETTAKTKKQQGGTSEKHKIVPKCNDQESPAKTYPKSDHPKDEPQGNEIHHNEKTSIPPEKKNATNATTLAASDKVILNKATINETRRTGGLGSVKVANISSHSFTVTWLAPQEMFKKFTVTKRELLSDGDKKEPLRVEEQDKSSTAGNTTMVENESTTASSGKAAGSETEAKRTSVVVPGHARSVEITNLQANTRYVLQVYGMAGSRRSRTHRVTATTGY